MKWFKPGLTEEELKKEYKKLAREHHPDVNPDNPDAEENFKEIATEYASYFTEILGANCINNIMDKQAVRHARMNIAEQIIRELYPRLDITMVTGIMMPKAEFNSPTTSITRIMTCLEIICETCGENTAGVTITRKDVSKPIIGTYYHNSRTYVVNGDLKAVTDNADDMTVVSAGRRYMHSAGKKVEQIVDIRNDILYMCRKTRSYSLKKDILGIK